MYNDKKPRKNILLVDDDEIHLEITEFALKDEYAVFLVKSGEEAFEFLEKSHIVPDLIILDILMPTMDGWVTFDKIQDISSLKCTPIMFYSTLDEASAKEKAYELGAFDYITKPCDQDVLLERIKKTLEKAEFRKLQYGL